MRTIESSFSTPLMVKAQILSEGCNLFPNMEPDSILAPSLTLHITSGEDLLSRHLSQAQTQCFPFPQSSESQTLTSFPNQVTCEMMVIVFALRVAHHSLSLMFFMGKLNLTRILLG